MTLTFRIAGASALLAAASMAITPAAAAELPLGARHAADVPVHAAWDSDAQDAANHRHYRYRRHRGVDTDDVIGGLLIIGGIAAIASAASNSARDGDYRYRDRSYPYRGGDYRDRPYQYRPYRGDSRYTDSRGINRAVDICVRAVERDVRVESVDSVGRLASGWRVEGSIYDGEGFTCRIGNDGRVDGIDYGARRWDGAHAGRVDDRQWSAEDYAAARRNQGGQPAYPGGPVDGDFPDDDRYGAVQAPGFGD